MTSHPPRAPGPTRSSLTTLTLDGESVELQAAGNRYFLRGGQGVEQELTEEEVARMRRHGADLAARAEASGLPVEESPSPASTWLGELRAKLPRQGLSVLVDTTTIFNAARALQTHDRPPSAVGLLDLSVLTNAAVLFDTIIIQPERFAPLDELHDLMQILQTDHEGHIGLDRTYGEVWRQFSRPNRLAEYGARWAKFLDVASDEVRVDVDAVRSRNSERMSFHYSSSTDIIDALGSPGGAVRRDHELAVVLGLQTIRAGFNDAVAGALGLPYLASSVRLPVSSDLADRKTQLLWVLRQLIARASPQAAPRDSSPFGTRAQIAAPLLLGLVLKRMSKPEDYRAALDEVREGFAPLRAQLSEDRETVPWDDKPQLSCSASPNT